MNTKLVTVYLGLGSNLGNRLHNLTQALGLLAPRVQIIQISSVFDTAPQENLHQPRFFNMAVRAETTLSPEALLAFVKEIEMAMGRKKTPPNSPRLIDIDILFYDVLVRQSPGLTLPHPKLTRRSFVLMPLAEISPELQHPTTHKTVQKMLQELRLDDQEILICEEETRCINLP